MPQQQDYFVRLDAPPPTSRHTPLERERHWEQPAYERSSARTRPQPRQRRRSVTIRPAGVLLLAILGWVAWAYTTPGGPSARIGDWINHTRSDVADMSLGPGLGDTARYFDGLYSSEGSYPHLSDTQLEQDPNASFGINMAYTWCSPSVIVLQSNGAGGSVSRLLLAGKDLGNVSGAYGCPANPAKPVPWKVPKPGS